MRTGGGGGFFLSPFWGGPGGRRPTAGACFGRGGIGLGVSSTNTGGCSNLRSY